MSRRGRLTAHLPAADLMPPQAPLSTPSSLAPAPLSQGPSEQRPPADDEIARPVDPPRGHSRLGNEVSVTWEIASGVKKKRFVRWIASEG